MGSKIAPGQMKRLHALLNQTGLLGRKHALVWEYTSGREESSKELLYNEAHNLILHLESLLTEEDRADKMRKKIISMAREMGYETLREGKKVADMDRINGWCEKFSYKHQGLNKYLYSELPALVTQFESYYRSHLKAI